MRLCALVAALLAFVPASYASDDPLAWDEIEADRAICLRQPIHFEQDDIAFASGQKLNFVEWMDLSAIGVWILTLAADECAFPNQSATPLSMPTESDDHRVVVEMRPDCLLEFYVETDDRSRNSLCGACR